MSFSNTAETSVIEQIFKGVALPWNANTKLWLALFTADPGEAGSIASEATYTGSARAEVDRATGFTSSGDTISNTLLAQFPLNTAGTNVITHAAIVTTVSGATTVIASNAIGSPNTVQPGGQPQFPALSLSFTLD
jgi:hypothetical protein